jgi:prepilin-type processing-associated H-X9-DG protein
MRRIAQFVVVLLILLICGGIGTISIVTVRRAAVRASCANNCRVAGISLKNYEEVNGRLPPAAIPNPDLAGEKRLSWIVDFIPYVEANNIYSRMDKEKSWDAEENRFATEMRLRFLQCPGYSAQPEGDHYGPTTYVGISGIGRDAIALPRTDQRAGIFGLDQSVKLDELKRGASQTILVVETSRVIGAWTAAGEPTTRGLIPDGSPYFGFGGQFGGNHPKGTNVVFADGSVRLIENTIDPTVWESMATLRGPSNAE